MLFSTGEEKACLPRKVAKRQNHVLWVGALRPRNRVFQQYRRGADVRLRSEASAELFQSRPSRRLDAESAGSRKSGRGIAVTASSVSGSPLSGAAGQQMIMPGASTTLLCGKKPIPPVQNKVSFTPLCEAHVTKKTLPHERAKR